MKFLYYILIAIVLLFNYSCANQPVKTKEEKEEVVVHKEIKEEYFDFFIMMPLLALIIKEAMI
jgi:hypothetical protein